MGLSERIEMDGIENEVEVMMLEIHGQGKVNSMWKCSGWVSECLIQGGLNTEGSVMELMTNTDTVYREGLLE